MNACERCDSRFNVCELLVEAEDDDHPEISWNICKPCLQKGDLWCDVHGEPYLGVYNLDPDSQKEIPFIYFCVECLQCQARDMPKQKMERLCLKMRTLLAPSLIENMESGSLFDVDFEDKDPNLIFALLFHQRWYIASDLIETIFILSEDEDDNEVQNEEEKIAPDINVPEGHVCRDSNVVYVLKVYGIQGCDGKPSDFIFCRPCLESHGLWCEKHGQHVLHHDEALEPAGRGKISVTHACTGCAREKTVALTPEARTTLCARARAKVRPDILENLEQGYQDFDMGDPESNIAFSTIILGDFYGMTPEELIDGMS